MAKTKLKPEILDRRMKSISMSTDMDTIKKTVITFIDAVDVEPRDGEDKSRTRTNEYPVKSTHIPHADFVAAMRELRDHALAMCEIDVTKSNKEDFGVVGVIVNGDLFMNQARVKLKLAKRVHRSNKTLNFPYSPEVTLSDESKYLAWKDLKTKVASAFDHAWDFIKGKHQDDNVPLAFQLSLDLPAYGREEREAEKEKKTESKHRRERVNKKKEKPATESATETEDNKPHSEVPNFTTETSPRMSVSA